MDYSTYEGVTVEVADGIATITLLFQGDDIPTRTQQHGSLTRIWRRLEVDDDVRVVLIRGVGDTEFYLSGQPPGSSPHGDLHAMWNFTRHLETEVEALVAELVRFRKPVITAINGAAGGAGMAVAVLGDISIMAEDAWFIDPHIMLGISAGDGPGGILPLYIGLAKTKLYMLTSDAISGIEAERIGLVGRVVPRADLYDVANDYARRLANAPEIALRFTKRGINQWLKLAELISQDYSLALEMLSDYSGERKDNPHTDWPPRLIP